MDALSRFLLGIGKSLGKGLTEVGAQELEQRQREETLRLQSLESIRTQLLNNAQGSV